MWIVRLALRRPYTFVVAALVLLLLTPFVLLRTPTDIFPEINIPVVSVVWVYNGLSAQDVEQRILYNHERMIATLVNDIEHTESTAYNGAGVIKVFLQPGASVSDAVGQLAASGQAALRFLPPGVTPPFIIRYNASSVPILQYSLASKKFSEQELQDMAMNTVKVGLSTVQGASVPYPYGGKARVVAVDLDLAAIQAKNLAPQDVVNAFNAQNFVLPSGTAKIGPTEYNISLNSNPAALAELNDFPVKTVNGAVIRVGDVAQVHDGYQPQQNVVRLDGMRGVLLTVLKSGSASTLNVVAGVRKVMPRILSGLPPDLQVKEFADQSLFVRAAISGSSQVQPNYWLNPKNGIQYLVNIRVPEYPMDSIEALNAMPISANRSGKSDAQILANLASFERATGSPIFSHYDVMPVIDVFGGVSGRDLGGVLKDIKPLIEEAKKKLPKGSFIMLRGQANTMHSSYLGLGVGLVLAVALIYLLLVVNFQSWLDPFIIITALPGALAGVVWGLYLTFTTLSVPALMGTIMSLGVATANSVLVVTFARNNFHQGLNPLNAAWEAGVGRLRPVLMTALAMIIGMLPMSLALGEGGEQNAPLGRAVIGGLILATAATLFFVPVIFSLLHREKAVASQADHIPSTETTID